MLLLLFYAGENLYALDSAQVVEVIPMVMLRPIHHAPDYVAGVFNYRSSIVPVIDLSYLIQGSACRSHLSTRIIMVNFTGRDGVNHCVGLMAERVTETLKTSDADLKHSEMRVEGAPYLGEIFMHEKGIIQRIHWEQLLADPRHTYLLSGGTLTTAES